MELGKFYSPSELYAQSKVFSGGYFPITKMSVWPYCAGGKNFEGSLYKIGAVVRSEAEIMDTAEGLHSFVEILI